MPGLGFLDNAALLAKAVRPSNPAKAKLALEGIKPGQVVAYHRGDLSYDRSRRKAVKELGDTAYALYNEGKLALVRVKVSTDVYDYLAIGSLPSAKVSSKPRSKRNTVRPPFSHPDVK